MSREEGHAVTRLEFPPNASIEEIMAIFAQSGAFDVLSGDEDKGEIRKVV